MFSFTNACKWQEEEQKTALSIPYGIGKTAAAFQTGSLVHSSVQKCFSTEFH